MTHQILPGSLEIDGQSVVAGVHTGPSEFDIENLRYVSANMSDGLPTDTVGDLLGRAYDNSEGCMVRGDFRAIRPA